MKYGCPFRLKSKLVKRWQMIDCENIIIIIYIITIFIIIIIILRNEF